MKMLTKLLGRVEGKSMRASISGLAALASIAALSLPASALASSKLAEEFAPFANCPVSSVHTCVLAVTSGGEFVIGNKTVPIDKSITLQGGLVNEGFAAQPLVAPTHGEALSKAPLTVPGGLVGIGELGGEVTATAELAGPASSVILDEGSFVFYSGTAVTLPLKVKLENAALGSDCYIGSDSEPIVLHLGTGKTSPPAPAESIHGSHSAPVTLGKHKIVLIEKDTLVDNDFSVPGASGCGGELSPLIDEAVDLDVGIPAAAGKNTAIMSGSLEETEAAFAVKYIPKEKRQKG
jgi:hypothetical protein